MQRPPVSDTAYFYMAEARKWAKLLSIIGFIGLGLMVISSFGIGAMIDRIYAYQMESPPLSGSFFVIFYLIMALIAFIPVWYLYKFSVSLGKALDNGLEEDMTSSFRFLKSHYKYLGILTIIMIAFSALLMVVAFFAAFFGALMV